MKINGELIIEYIKVFQQSAPDLFEDILSLGGCPNNLLTEKEPSTQHKTVATQIL